MLHFEFLMGLLPKRRPARAGDVVHQRGASLVEYSLLVALIAVVCIGAVAFFGGELNSSLSNAGDSIN